MSIRLQVVFLAFVALFSLGIACYFEYQNVQERQQVAQRTFAEVEEIAQISQLIHPLQKERGLTAGILVKSTPELRKLLDKQRKLTDSIWEKASTIPSLAGDPAILNTPASLQELRKRIDENSVEWKEVKEVYTAPIDRLLLTISQKLSILHQTQEVSFELSALSHLSRAREHLGLLRANLTRVYQRGERRLSELLDTSLSYGKFQSEFQLFTSYLSGNDEEHYWLPRIETDTFQSVLSQLEFFLRSDDAAFADRSAVIWWEEASLVIDTMKSVEEQMLDHIVISSRTILKDLDTSLFRYTVVGILLLLSVAVLTVSVVKRILQALAILLRTLKTVEQTQNFKVRIMTQSEDEFGQISYSINHLLQYTDEIIKEKDNLATTDLLTGVMNRRSLLEIAQKEIHRSERYGTQLAIVFCDIDHFKIINDTYGHSTGDDVLRVFASILKKNVRESDLVARWGGEEFIILIPENPESVAAMLAEKLRKLLMEVDVSPVKELSCSFGVAEKMPKESFESLCDRADKALYRAKFSGRNRVCAASDINEGENQLKDA